MTIEAFNLAQNLEGRVIDGWRIIKRIDNRPSSGGAFSVGYEVEKMGSEKCFLKALDYSSALGKPNQVDILSSMTNAYIFERNLLARCNDRRLRYIIKLVSHGSFQLPEDEYPDGVSFCPNVDYIILERADDSLRHLIDLSRYFDCAWALRSLHNVAVGVEEMHGIQAAHQDIKPSNILVFKTRQLSKIGDVGRSSVLGSTIEHDAYACAGDRRYSPFEQLYGDTSSDWKMKRYSCDMFMFGNLIMTYFNNISITTSVINKLPHSSRPTIWGDTYLAILPQIEKAFAECLAGFNTNIDSELRTELIEMVQQLCHPDVAKRGDRKNSHLGSQQYSLRRYISKLDILAQKCGYKYRKVML